MKTYNKSHFRDCQRHPKMECRDVKIDDHSTICQKVETENYMKGVCVPRKYRCKTTADCPNLYFKDSKDGSAKLSSVKVPYGCQYNHQYELVCHYYKSFSSSDYNELMEVEKI